MNVFSVVAWTIVAIAVVAMATDHFNLASILFGVSSVALVISYYRHRKTSN